MEILETCHTTQRWKREATRCENYKDWRGPCGKKGLVADALSNRTQEEVLLSSAPVRSSESDVSA